MTIEVKAEDGRAFLRVADRIEANGRDPLEAFDGAPVADLAIRLLALSTLQVEQIRDVVESLAAYATDDEWRHIQRVLRAVARLVPSADRLAERASVLRADAAWVARVHMSVRAAGREVVQ